MLRILFKNKCQFKLDKLFSKKKKKKKKTNMEI